jgi:ribosome-associated translation inhibitor RaiA
MSTDLQIQVAARGAVGDEYIRYAEEKIRAVTPAAPRPVLFARVALSQHENPSVERPASAKATLDVSGRLVRAHVAAPTMREAVDLLEDRLRRRLDILAERRQQARHETGLAEPGEWRHGSLPTPRPAHFLRPPEERELVRHKTYEYTALAPKEAALDLELLDFDFHLFRNSDTGGDCVVHRRPDGTLGLVETAPSESVEEAIDRLEATGEPFVFFNDPESGRGNVLYHRYDGHYGLITPATA